MENCSVSFEAIVDYYEERSDATTQERIRQHLESGCESCQIRLSWLQKFLPALRAAVTRQTLSAPEEALALARQIARDRLRTVEDQPIRRRVAESLFDSRLNAKPATEQGTVGYEVQRLYGTDDHYIDVRIERMQEGEYSLAVQTVSRTENAPVRAQSVALVGPDGSRRQAEQEGNEFRLFSVTVGSYQICISLETEEILLPEFTVGV